MLKYENNLLEVSNTRVNSSDFILKLKTDIDASILGILILSDQSKKVIEFVKTEDKYLGRLLITENDIRLLSSSRFHLELINAEFQKNSNVVELQFDIESIKLDVKKKLADEYKEIVERLIKLENKVNDLKSSKVLNGLNITNKSSIRHGMVPVAIDDKGNFVALYPFSNTVTEVNGQHAANGAVVIDSSMIEYKLKGTTVEEALRSQAQAIVSINDLVKSIVDTQKDLMTRLNEIDMKIESHINNGII